MGLRLQFFVNLWIVKYNWIWLHLAHPNFEDVALILRLFCLSYALSSSFFQAHSHCSFKLSSLSLVQYSSTTTTATATTSSSSSSRPSLCTRGTFAFTCVSFQKPRILFFLLLCFVYRNCGKLIKIQTFKPMIQWLSFVFACLKKANTKINALFMCCCVHSVKSQNSILYAW